MPAGKFLLLRVYHWTIFLQVYYRWSKTFALASIGCTEKRGPSLSVRFTKKKSSLKTDFSTKSQENIPIGDTCDICETHYFTKLFFLLARFNTHTWQMSTSSQSCLLGMAHCASVLCIVLFDVVSWRLLTGFPDHLLTPFMPDTFHACPCAVDGVFHQALAVHFKANLQVSLLCLTWFLEGNMVVMPSARRKVRVVPPLGFLFGYMACTLNTSDSIRSWYWWVPALCWPISFMKVCATCTLRLSIFATHCWTICSMILRRSAGGPRGPKNQKQKLRRSI